MDNKNNTGIESECKALFSAFQGQLSWKWDEHRFGAVLAEFGVDEQSKVRAMLQQHLGTIWDDSNIDTAPTVVQQVKSVFGELTPGQLLFTADTDQDVFLYGVWWPWGNGQTISIRVAPASKYLSDVERLDLDKHFRQWFKV